MSRFLACCLCLLASPALAQNPIRYFATDATIDGSQLLDIPDEIRIYPGVAVTMIGGDYSAIGGGGDYGVTIGGGGYGGRFIMQDGGLDQAWFSGQDTFQLNGGFINSVQVGSLVPGGAAIFGGVIKEQVQAINSLHIHGGTFPGGLYPLDDSWIYLFGDDLKIESGRITGELESGDTINLTDPGNTSIIRSDHIYGDVDFDGDIDLSDLNLVRNNFGLVGAGDANLDSVVGLEDLNLVRNNFGAISSRPVSEPSSLVLLALGAAEIVAFRRRCRPPVNR